MSDQIAVSVDSISKTYRLYNSYRDRIKEILHPFRKLYHHKFHALQDVSFQIEKGEVVGIIGQNGSGKSTLFKILASVSTPTSGSFYCNGKVTALLELGGGFNRDLTGIENIYFLGAIQGYTKKEMKSIIQKILDFADIGEYVYQPVKTYSSGMYVRLAFSIAINVDPDILITDEVLSVGDIRFQQKCYRKIRDFKDKGKTILLCTHSLSAVREFCTKAIWIHQGKIMEQGDPLYVTNSYNAFMTSQERVPLSKGVSGSEGKKSLQLNEIAFLSDYPEIEWFDLSKCESYGVGGMQIQYAAMYDIETNKKINLLKGGEKVRVFLHLIANQKIEKPCVHLTLNGQFGTSVFKINTYTQQQQLVFEPNKPITIAIDFTFPKISNGRYTMSFGSLPYSNENSIYSHWVHDALILEVSNPDTKYKMGTQLVIDEATVKIIS